MRKRGSQGGFLVSKIRIQLVDDHQIVLDGLRSLLQKRSDFEVVAECRDGLTALQAAQNSKPDVVIMDVTLPGLSGIETTRRLLAKLPDIKIIALSMHSDQLYITEMLRVGAHGYLLKDDDFEELVTAIRQAIRGHIYLSSSIREMSVGEFLGRGDTNLGGSLSRLTSREREVLHWIATGESVRGLAARLNVSPKTLYTHREHLMTKLGVRSGAELLKVALQSEKLRPDIAGPGE